MAEFETDRMKRLKAQRAAIDARMRQEQYKLNKQERARDTHRKVLVGAAMMEWAKRSNENSLALDTELKHFITRNDERALFGLPPLPEKNDLHNPGGVRQ